MTLLGSEVMGINVFSLNINWSNKNVFMCWIVLFLFFGVSCIYFTLSDRIGIEVNNYSLMAYMKFTTKSPDF